MNMNGRLGVCSVLVHEAVYKCIFVHSFDFLFYCVIIIFFLTFG